MSFFEISDPAFGRFVMGNAPVKQLATGFDWVEGPVWFGDLDCLLFSDIPNNRILRWMPDGSLTTFVHPPILPMAIPETDKGAWSVVNTVHGV